MATTNESAPRHKATIVNPYGASRGTLPLQRPVTQARRDFPSDASPTADDSAAPRPRSALEMLQADESKRISLGCPVLNAAFGGGLPRRGIVEVAGEAGAGKTQLCLQLLVNSRLEALRHGTSGHACVLSCGEGAFPSGRLRQIADSAVAACSGPELQRTSGSVLTDGISVLTVRSADEQAAALKAQLPELMARERVRLVVIDSMSGLLRAEIVGNGRGCGADVAARARLMGAMAQQMKRLSDEHDCPFIVVNQVTARPGGSTAADVDANVPALGLAWSNCVNHRFVLKRLHGRRPPSRPAVAGLPLNANCEREGAEATWSSREMRVELSSLIPHGASCGFYIDAPGVSGRPQGTERPLSAFS